MVSFRAMRASGMLCIGLILHVQLADGQTFLKSDARVLLQRAAVDELNLSPLVEKNSAVRPKPRLRYSGIGAEQTELLPLAQHWWKVTIGILVLIVCFLLSFLLYQIGHQDYGLDWSPNWCPNFMNKNRTTVVVTLPQLDDEIEIENVNRFDFKRVEAEIQNKIDEHANNLDKDNKEYVLLHKGVSVYPDISKAPEKGPSLIDLLSGIFDQGFGFLSTLTDWLHSNVEKEPMPDEMELRFLRPMKSESETKFLLKESTMITSRDMTSTPGEV